MMDLIAAEAAATTLMMSWLGVAVVVILGLITVWFLFATMTEIEHRLGRSPRLGELIAFAVCLPYSLLIVWFLLPPRPSIDRKEEH